MLRKKVLLLVSIAFVAASFLLGINWGLPSRSVDSFLFGGRKPWTGGEIMQILGDRQSGAGLGADVDRNPLNAGPQPQLLNGTDQQRAEIVRRYRLYSYQPDEMITFMSLAGMKPRQLKLDPQLYQYGGLWIYPVGGLLGAGSALGLINLKTDLTYYLDHPEAFGRFYIAARFYAAAFGIVGALCIWWIVMRLSQSTIACSFAVIAYAMLPVVNNMAHEAKPHLPGAVLMLLSIIAAVKFVESGRRRWWIGAGVLCGAATGMILSAAPICIILPIMALLRTLGWKDRVTILIAAGLLAVDVYFLTNPYVTKHLIAWNNPDNPLRSNLANSKAMYSAGFSVESLLDAGRLLGYAATWAVIVAGVAGGAALLLRGRGATGTSIDPSNEPMPRPSSGSARGAVSLLLLAPAAVILMQFVALAAGKPGEYARFALFPSVVLLIFGFAGIAVLVRHHALAGVMMFSLAAATAVHGISYVWHFLLDAQPRTTRTIVADRLRTSLDRGAESIAVYAEPAPYAVPPMDLWRWQIWLRRPAGALAVNDRDLSITVVDHHPALVASPANSQPDRAAANWIRARLLPTPISWAAKPFVVAGKSEFLSPTEPHR